MTQKQTTVIYNLTAAVTLDEKLQSTGCAFYPGTAESSLFKEVIEIHKHEREETLHHSDLLQYHCPPPDKNYFYT